MRLPSKKLRPRYTGPFTVTKQINPVTYQLKVPSHYRIHPTFHASLLKPNHSPIPTSIDPGLAGEPALPLILEDGRTSTSNAAKAELLKTSKTQITPVTIFSVYCHLASASGAWRQKPRDWGGASSLKPPGSLTQTQFHKHLQDSFTFTIIRIAATCIYPVQPVCTSLLHIPVHITIY